MASNRKNAKNLVLCLMMFSFLTSVSAVLFVAFVLILAQTWPGGRRVPTLKTPKFTE